MVSSSHHLDLASVIRLCREESHQERQAEHGYCFELFRRALTNNDQAAWEAIQRQYQGLISSWLRRANGEFMIASDEEDLIHTIFVKFWISLNRKEGLLSETFPHIGALLKYLNRCALTTFLDFQNHEQRQIRLRRRLVQEVKVDGYATNPIPKFVEHEEQQEKLLAIREWARTQITDELEKNLYQLLYCEGLKPREIVARYPHLFPTTEDIRRVQARMLARARRALATIEPK